MALGSRGAEPGTLQEYKDRRLFLILQMAESNRTLRIL